MTTIGTQALGIVNLIIAQGADNTFQFRYGIKGPAGTEPADLSDWTARMQIRNRVGGDVWLDLDSEDGIYLGSDGSVVINIAHEITEDPKWNAYANTNGVYDLELISPTNVVTRFLQGKVDVSPDVTRRP